jgi:hypothetical protein
MHRTIQLILLLVVGLLTTTAAQARTWHVNTAGTGDAPNLYAAMTSAAAFDTVLVAPGHYVLSDALNVPPNVRLIGEAGPGVTTISRDAFAAPVTISLSNAWISGIRVVGNTSPVLFISGGGSVDHCVVEGALLTELVSAFGTGSFQNCLFINGPVGAYGVYTQCIILGGLDLGAAGSSVFASDVLGEVHPSVSVLPDNLDFSLDPQFCGIPGGGNFFLQSTSPCLPQNNPFGPAPFLVGPLGQGCGAVRTEPVTWGAIKARYR